VLRDPTDAVLSALAAAPVPSGTGERPAPRLRERQEDT
jgi:hypothetical protein